VARDGLPTLIVTDKSQQFSERLRDPGFTPGVRDVPKLLSRWHELLASGSVAKQRKTTKLMVQALGRADRPVASLLLRDLWQGEAAERGLRVRVLSRIAARIDLPELAQVLARALSDSDAKVARAGLRAIGKLEQGVGVRFENDVVAHLQASALPEQRAAADALGKIGGEAGLTALRAASPRDDDLARRCAQAIALIERRQLRGQSTEILTEARLPSATRVVLRCRSGAAEFAKEQACSLLELRDQEVELDPLGVAVSWQGSLERLHRVRIALDAALEFDLLPGTDLETRIVRSLAQPRLIESLAAWSDGPLRFRLSFLDGSARRAIVRAIASSLTERGVPLHNDSRRAPWSVQVDIEHARLLCVPRDPGLRFAYERAHIPAASHPTLAALMAWVARPRGAEVVWDPFCGSGSELIECALLEPGVRLYGTDNNATALAAAKRNLKAAGVVADLVQADALRVNPTVTPSLIITNPPMGRRASLGYGVHELLRSFVARAAALLPADGRLVWVTPAAKVSAAAGRDAGLRVTDHGPVDLAGMRVHLQVMAR